MFELVDMQSMFYVFEVALQIEMFVYFQDFTGVPAVVDLACMRDAINNLGGDSNKINPLVCMVLHSYVYKN